jgi:hypothetical protein
LEVFDSLITLNKGSIGSGTARNAGIQIRDNNSDSQAYIKTSGLGSSYVIKAPENSYVLSTPILTDNSDIIINNGIQTFNSSVVIHRDLTVSGSFVLSGNTEYNGGVIMKSSLTVAGPVVHSSTLTNIGTMNLQSTLNVAGDVVHSSTVINVGNVSNSGTMFISGITSINSNLLVAGPITGSNTLTIIGSTNLQSSLAITGNLTSSGTLTTVGAVNFQSTLAVAGNLTSSGTLTTVGAVNLQSTLAVAGNLTSSGTLTTVGAVNLQSSLNLARDMTASGTLTMVGEVNLQSSLNIAGHVVQSGTLTTIGAINFQSSLNIAGNMITSGTLTTVGTVNLQSNLTLKGDFTSSGTVILESTLAIAGSITSSGTLTTVGPVNLQSTLNVKANLISSGILVNVGSVSMLSTLYVASSLGVGVSNPAYSLDVNGSINFNGTLYQNSSVFVSSQWTSSGNNIYYNAGNVGVGTSNPSAGLDVNSTTIIRSSLTVVGPVVQSGTLTTVGTVNMSSTLNVGSTITNNNYLVPASNIYANYSTLTLDNSTYSETDVGYKSYILNGYFNSTLGLTGLPTGGPTSDTGISSDYDLTNNLLYTSDWTAVKQYNPATKTWTTIGSVPGGGIFNMGVHQPTGDVYVCTGNGTVVNGVSIYYAGRWNKASNTWTNLAASNVAPNGNCFVVKFDGTDTAYFAGGFAKLNNDTSLAYIAKYTISTSTWSALSATNKPGQPPTPIGTIEIDGTNIYTGGGYTNSFSYFTKYDTLTNTWSNPDPTNTITNNVNVIKKIGGYLYIGVDSNGLYKYQLSDGTITLISSLTSGQAIYAIASSPDESIIYVGGNFTTLGGSSIVRLASSPVSSISWTQIGNVSNNYVSRLPVLNDGTFYISGGFTSPYSYIMYYGSSASRIISKSGYTFSNGSSTLVLTGGSDTFANIFYNTATLIGEIQSEKAIPVHLGTSSGLNYLNGDFIINSGKSNADLYFGGKTTVGHNGLRLGYNSGSAILQSLGSGSIQIAADTTTGSTTRLMITNSSGYVGIGTTSPTERLHVIGNIKASGDVYATNFINPSDARLKKNIINISYDECLNKIVDLPVHQFQYNNEESDKKQIGFIAQEVETKISEAVDEKDGYKNVDKDIIFAYAVGAINQLNKRVQELENQIQELLRNK